MLKAEFKSLQTFSLPTQKHTHTLTQMWKYSHSTVGLFGLFRFLKKTLVDVDVVKLEHCPTSKTHLQSITYPEWDSLPHTNNNVQAFLVPLEAVKHIRWICIWLMEILIEGWSVWCIAIQPIRFAPAVSHISACLRSNPLLAICIVNLSKAY